MKLLVARQGIGLEYTKNVQSKLHKKTYYKFTTKCGMFYSLILGNFRILYEEIDYVNEGKNADRFRRDFRNIKWVRVPVCFLLS